MVRSAWFLLLIIVALFTSCRSNKDLSYLRDTWPTKKLAGLPRAHSDYKIKVNDNLYVSIVSANLEMNEIYNPSTIGSGNATNNIC